MKNLLILASLFVSPLAAAQPPASPAAQNPANAYQAVANYIHELNARRLDLMAHMQWLEKDPASQLEFTLSSYLFEATIALDEMPADFYPYVRARQELAHTLVAFFKRSGGKVDHNLEFAIFDMHTKLTELLDQCYPMPSKAFQMANMLLSPPTELKKIAEQAEALSPPIDQEKKGDIQRQCLEAAAAQRAKIKPLAKQAIPALSEEQRALRLYALRRTIRGFEEQVQAYKEGRGDDEALLKSYHETLNDFPMDALAPRMQEYLKAMRTAVMTNDQSKIQAVREDYKREDAMWHYSMLRLIFDCATVSPELATETQQSLLVRPEQKDTLPARIKALEQMIQVLQAQVTRLEGKS